MIPIEPQRADPKADRITYRELLKQFRWTDADYLEAQKYAFPNAIAFAYGGWVSVTRQAIFSKTQIAVWHDVLQTFAGRLPRKL